jgi:hypothetical protein
MPRSLAPLLLVATWLGAAPASAEGVQPRFRQRVDVSANVAATAYASAAANAGVAANPQLFGRAHKPSLTDGYQDLGENAMLMHRTAAAQLGQISRDLRSAAKKVQGKAKADLISAADASDDAATQHVIADDAHNWFATSRKETPLKASERAAELTIHAVKLTDGVVQQGLVGN